MNYLTPESEQQEYIERCRKAYSELHMEKVAYNLELLNQKSEQSEPTPMPYYPRQEP